MKLIILGEGTTEWEVMPILFSRCANICQNDLDIKPIRCRPFVGRNSVLQFLQKTYHKYAAEKAVLLVGIDNDHNSFRHTEEHSNSPDEKCHFCYLQEEIKRLKTKAAWQNITLATIVFVPVEVIESWLLFGADLVGKTKENHPEEISKDQAKNKFCGTDKITSPIIEKYHKPVAEKIDLERLKQNVPSFNFFYQQVQEFVSNSNK